uniref:Uncharacterized protein n=1 Tax=Hyaloperonospora arabidopsidis (strain Emoy2) TaxID=559515 RepID=M4C3V1_HYAAE
MSLARMGLPNLFISVGMWYKLQSSYIYMACVPGSQRLFIRLVHRRFLRMLGPTTLSLRNTSIWCDMTLCSGATQLLVRGRLTTLEVT